MPLQVLVPGPRDCLTAMQQGRSNYPRNPGFSKSSQRLRRSPFVTCRLPLLGSLTANLLFFHAITSAFQVPIRAVESGPDRGRPASPYPLRITMPLYLIRFVTGDLRC
jgi:hypothetical protein